VVNQDVPDALITLDPDAPAASAVFDQANNVWTTTIPFDLHDHAFLTGIPWIVPPAGLPADIGPVTWCGTFSSDVDELNTAWRWAAAAYSSFTSNEALLAVQPMNAVFDGPGDHGDRAGTPENYKDFVIPGARGEGGKNYTGTPTVSSFVEWKPMNWK
jgi:hypothetical protein